MKLVTPVVPGDFITAKLSQFWTCNTRWVPETAPLHVPWPCSRIGSSSRPSHRARPSAGGWAARRWSGSSSIRYSGTTASRPRAILAEWHAPQGSGTLGCRCGTRSAHEAFKPSRCRAFLPDAPRVPSLLRHTATGKPDTPAAFRKFVFAQVEPLYRFSQVLFGWSLPAILCCPPSP